ncbi:MAG: sigma 54-interacting transcriptional regulator [Butyricicoccus sp.]|nr:sigma 54-interacting transcriptional regulator [Butyricicoccus sp.]MBQ8586358.1 sigma 54-interacting transcriptional regulator [Butyricicoccus sp.]
MKEQFGEKELRQILESIQTPILITSIEGASLYANPQWLALRARISEQMPMVSAAVIRTAQTGLSNRLELNGFILLITPVQLEHGIQYVLVQRVLDEMQEGLREQLEDTVKTNVSYQAKLSHFGTKNYIATSDRMIRVFMKAKQVAAYPTTILLLGETGVGKEVVSSFIHNNSDRVGKPFIKINCSAIPEPLMESELFGYESGAFTGAKDKGKMGLFELANHGTILLDEIGDMSLALQAKLLRAIQESEIVRVGGSKPIKLDVRIISATSRDIEEMMEEGTFLDALYYRLNVVEIQIPPLRERREDILPLAEFYLQHFCEKYKLSREFSPEIQECFIQYSWPGNVRELRNIVENLAVSAVDREIAMDDLPARMIKNRPLQNAVLTQTGSLKTAVESLQKQMIEDAVQREGSLRKAAAALDMDPTTLNRLAKKLGVGS